MPTAWTAYTNGQVMNPPGPGPVIEQLHTSAFERLKAAFGDSWASVSGRSAITRPTAGQPFLKASLWGNQAGPVVSGTNLIAIDNALFYPGVAGFNESGFAPFGYSTLTRFIDHTATIEGAAVAPSFWTMPSIRSAASLPATKFYTWSGSGAATLDGTKANTLMKRVRYRMITGVNPSRDTQGNAATTGQRAFAADGTRWRYDGTNWQRDESAPADLIDNTQAPPDTVCEYIGVGSPPAVTWGAPQLGDIALAHLFEERRLVMDLMRWTLLPLTPNSSVAAAVWVGVNHQSTNGGASNSASPGNPSSAADAESQASTAYAANTPSVGPNGAFGDDLPQALNTVNHYLFGLGQEWDAAGNRSQMDYSPAYGDSGTGSFSAFTLSALAKKFAFYSKAQPPSGGGGVVTAIFDAQGDPVTNGTYHAWDNGGPTTGTPTSAALGNVAAFPANYTDPPTPGTLGTSDRTIQGYEVIDVFAVLKWNVAGGFSYCTVTD